MQREICIDAAKKLNQHEIAARMVIDANYAKLFTELVRHFLVLPGILLTTHALC